LDLGSSFIEHLYTGTVKTQLRKTLGELEIAGKSPRIVLTTTILGEQHNLGLIR